MTINPTKATSDHKLSTKKFSSDRKLTPAPRAFVASRIA